MKKLLSLPVYFVALFLTTVSACAENHSNDDVQPRDDVHQRGEGEQCPEFLVNYSRCTVRFAGPGPEIRIDSFKAVQNGPAEFLFVGNSNRGELPFPVVADRVVRLGQDQRVNPDGTLEFFRTHESSFCEQDRVVGHQMILLPNGRYEIQVLEFIKEGENLVFKLATDGEPGADVICQP